MTASSVPVVALVGIGGLGCPAAYALATSGVAMSLRLLDEDRVERGNLHRQSLFSDCDAGLPKVFAAARALRALRPGLAVEANAEHVAPDTAVRLLAGASVLVEGSDNFPTKFLVSDVAHAMGVPVVHGACVGWQGTVMPVHPTLGACYRCVFESPPEGADADAVCDCSTAGVFGPVTSVLGALMAADALRFLRGDLRHAGNVVRYNGWQSSFRATRFTRRADCPSCAVELHRSTAHPYHNEMER